MWEELISICVGVDGNNGIELIWRGFFFNLQTFLE